MLTPQEKQKVIESFRTHESDTGSPEVQAALLSKEIERLLAHLKKHRQDVHSKRGLLKMVAHRRSLLKYLEREDGKRYASLVKRLGLKK